MTEPNPLVEPSISTENVESENQKDSMREYYQLKQNLLLVTVAITGLVFASVWLTYSLNTALNYLLGACVGLFYLRMLAKDVEKLGGEKKSIGSGRLALFVGLIIVATQWEQLKILPIFLGFMTYKAALIVYVLQTTLLPAGK